MQDYGPSTYGDRIADVYDLFHSAYDPAAIDLLQELAAGGPALELGIGTGRLAVPLMQRGIHVHGIEASEAMARKLREKANDIPVTIGDFASFALDERFSLVFVVFNTLFALATQEAQVGYFRTVAAHLREGGRFLVEAFVPDPGRFDRGQRLAVSNLEVEGVMIEASRHDPSTQRVDAHLVHITSSGTHLYPVAARYAWPSELDLMARLAGLALEHRWAGWRRQPFGPESTSHVSVYRK